MHICFMALILSGRDAKQALIQVSNGDGFVSVLHLHPSVQAPGNSNTIDTNTTLITIHMTNQDTV